MNDIFPFDKLALLKGYEGDYFIYTLDKGNFQDKIVEKQIKYCPGVYLVYNYSNDMLGDILYCGKAGADLTGYINKHQLPKRLLATCNLPDNYPALNGKRKDITRDMAWIHMMRHDNFSKIIVFYFYTKLTTTKDQLIADPTPAYIEKQIHEIFRKNGVTKFKWSTKKERE